jgi:crotonobetainyl-CoA:carnitine CoA-transferase CaiB-like acyl-CoA transferase
MARIVELAGHSAAYGGRLLAEMGHDVIRVEPPQGDALRRLGPFLGGKPDLENGACHQFLNAGKRSFILDVNSEPGCKMLRDLLATSEALLGQAPLPLGEDDLSANPKLVVVRIDDSLPELCTYARSGLLALTGHPDRRPMLLGGHAAYAATGTFAALALMAALLMQQTMRLGQVVDLSAQACLDVLGEQAVIAETVTGEKFERRGYRGAVTAISGGFRCADGYAMLSVPPQAESWARFMEWVQDPVLLEDDSLADEAERRAKQEFVLDRLESWTQRLGKEELVVQAQLRHTPAAPVSTPLDLAEDPQLIARGFLRTVEHPELGSMLFPEGALATLTGFQPTIAPRLGQHNSEILTELGYSASQQESIAWR